MCFLTWCANFSERILILLGFGGLVRSCFLQYNNFITLKQVNMNSSNFEVKYLFSTNTKFTKHSITYIALRENRVSFEIRFILCSGLLKIRRTDRL